MYGLRFKRRDYHVFLLSCVKHVSDVFFNAFSFYFQWKETYSWFPGYAWKVCVCPKCSTFLGWMFEPIETATSTQEIPSKKGFYALSLGGIISDSCNYNFSQDFFCFYLPENLFLFFFLDLNSLLMTDWIK